MKKYLEVGKIVNVHGIYGDVKVLPWCDSANFICGFDTLYSDGGKNSFAVKKARVLGNVAILRFDGVDTAEKANALRQTVLYIDRDDVTLPEGSHFIADLIGLAVYDEQEKCYGTVKDVLKTGANDVYEIEGADGSLYYIPAIPSVILDTRIDEGKIVIFPMEGLF